MLINATKSQRDRVRYSKQLFQKNMFSLPLQKRKDFVVDEQDNEELSGLHMSRILLKEGVPPGIRRQVVGGAWLSSARAIRY